MLPFATIFYNMHFYFLIVIHMRKCALKILYHKSIFYRCAVKISVCKNCAGNACKKAPANVDSDSDIDFDTYILGILERVSKTHLLRDVFCFFFSSFLCNTVGNKSEIWYQIISRGTIFAFCYSSINIATVWEKMKRQFLFSLNALEKRDERYQIVKNFKKNHFCVLL